MEALTQQASIATRIANKIPYILLFLFSAAINAAFGYRFNIVYCFTLFFLLLLILKFSRRLYITLTLFLTLLAAFYFPFAQVFGSPNYIIISSAFYTNKNEASNFLGSIPFLYYIGSFLLIILGIRVTCLSINPTIKRTKLIISFILLSVLFAPLKLALTESKFNLMAIGFTPVKFLIEAYQATYSTYQQYKEFNQIITKKDDWKDVSAHPNYKTYILVIGESARKDFMHNYGFPINNTPFVSQSQGLFFNNYLSAGPGQSSNPTAT